MKTNPDDGAFAAAAIGKIQTLRSDGLTKREYFAAMALQGMLAASNLNNNPEYLDQNAFTKHAVSLADKLIKALNEDSK